MHVKLRDEPVDGGAFGVLGKGGGQRSGHDRAHPVDAYQVGPRVVFRIGGGVHRGGECVPGAIVQGQQVRRRFAHMAHAKAEDQARQRDLATVINGVKKVAGRFVAPALAVFQLLHPAAVTIAQGEDVGRLGNPAVGVELFDLFGAQTFDVEGTARNEML